MLFEKYASCLKFLLLAWIFVGTFIKQVTTLDLRAPFSRTKREIHEKPGSYLHQRLLQGKRQTEAQSSAPSRDLTTAENSDDGVSGAVNTPNDSEKNTSRYFNSSNQTTSSSGLYVINSTPFLNHTSSNAVSNVTSTKKLNRNSSITYNTSVGARTDSFRPSNSSSSTSTLASVFAPSAMKRNELYLGFLPDDGSGGGSRQTMAQINDQLGGNSAGYGWYAQAKAGTTFDGSQLLAVIDDVKACNCVFQPALMPIGGWQGFTTSDNSQAVAIANVMKKFTDEGIPVWMRFAHEANFYQTDGTYQGTAQDFKEGWATVSAAVKSIAPQVKMWWTPNVATAENYAQYEPADLSTVDLVGVDYYPKQLTGSDFVDTMQVFHDKYAVDGRMFAIGETGLGWGGSIDDRFKWLAEIVAAKSSMPQFLAMSWFNYQKGYDFRVAGETSLNHKYTSFVAS